MARTACFSCVGSGKATPRKIPDATCPRCNGSGVEPGQVAALTCGGAR